MSTVYLKSLAAEVFLQVFELDIHESNYVSFSLKKKRGGKKENQQLCQEKGDFQEMFTTKQY